MIFNEDQHTEFKENVKSSTIVNEIVGFLNTCDGVIYIGVRDDGEVIGLDNINNSLLIISNIIADQIEPSPRELIEVDTPVFENKQIIKIVV